MLCSIGMCYKADKHGTSFDAKQLYVPYIYIYICVCVCIYIYIYIYIYIEGCKSRYTSILCITLITVYLLLHPSVYIQGVPGGMDKTLGECSLC